MAASTITRATWTNDTGTASAPNLDGTVLNNTRLQNDIYAKIDEMLAGAGTYATLTFGGKIAVEGFGTHAFSAGGAGGNILGIRNTTAGAGNYGAVQIGNDSSATRAILQMFSTTFTPSGTSIADGLTVTCAGAGGLNLSGSHASGWVRLYQAGSLVFQTNVLGGGAPQPFLPSGAYGAGGVGASFYMKRNTSGGGAPGQVIMDDKAGTPWFIWPDSSGLARIGATQPNETSGDTGGTIIGTQVSQRAAKRIYGEVADGWAALARLRQTPVWEFDYASGAFSGQRFRGITTDDSPDYGMDDGRCFNPVTAFGDTVLAIRELARRLDDLAPGLWA